MKFTYRAIKDGKAVKSHIEAESEAKVAEFLKSKNYIIIKISSRRASLAEAFNKTFARVGFSDIVALTRQIAIMLHAGLTIAEGIAILKKQTTKPVLNNLFNDLDEKIKGGISLSQALKKHSKLFSNLYISLVKAGEASGKLDQIMAKLSDNLEKQRAFQAKIKGALIYPAIIVVGMVTVIFIMITFVIPQLLNLYKELNVELPTTTQALISISSFFQSYWLFMLIGLIIFLFVFLNLLKTPSGRRTFDGFLFKIPKINDVIKISALVNTTRTLGILIQSGVSILEALSIIEETSGNSVYRESFQKISEKIEKGRSLGTALDESGLFPPILVQMVTVGEETGHLDETLLRLADYFEEESELVTKAIVTIIEPAVIVTLGVAVGFIVISVITPIFSLAGSIK